MDKELEHSASELGDRLRSQALTIATAESCTGGWVAKVLTDIAGSSAWFERGFITYSNAAKQEMLGVRPDLIDTEGAVSEAVVREMVRGVIANSDADLALAVSGIAGPGGGTPEKPVGTVWFAWGRSGSAVVTRMLRFSGDRERVRRQAVLAALRGALDLIE
ncbi:MAG: nicotinamide-nucleotide amidase [Chromatiaceae bacterium]|nr:nicotinamide-nucleotide amidase [Chromatiaceae bacterium]MCP5441551.1 nicotinamide-nucleotide amidase [Chromatiaceae bacterium]